MEKVHMKDAEKDGFIIDTCCNPAIAYKGPRFQPTSLRECYSPLESELLQKVAVLGEVATLLRQVTESVNPFTSQAQDLLTKLDLAAAPA